MAMLPDEAVEAVARAICRKRVESEKVFVHPDEYDAEVDRRWLSWRPEARAALAALSPWIGEVEGWVLVPREAAQAQLTAGINAEVTGYGDNAEYPPVACDHIDNSDEVDRLHGLERDAARQVWTDALLAAIYRAMIAAAPRLTEGER